MDPCTLCETRKPRRHCLAAHADICSQCCGQEREVSLDCPFECEYLSEARKHDKTPPVDEASLPNRDVRLTQEFVYELEPVIAVLMHAVLDAAAATPGAVDNDVREALGALIKTYRTMQSGLIYDTRPANPYADSIQQRVRASIEDFKRRIHEAQGMHTIRDSEILGCLVFVERLELQNNNGRRRGRAFLHSLYEMRIRQMQAAEGQPAATP